MQRTDGTTAPTVLEEVEAVLERLAIRASDKGLIGWLFVAFLVLGPLYLNLALAIGIRRKWRDPEWRRLADKWTWLGMAVGLPIYVFATSFVLLSGIATTVVWLRS